MSVLVHHAERCPPNPLLQAFIAWWQVSGPFPLVVTFGNRTEAEQLKLYAQGRSLPGKIVTWARTAAESAHGHSGAIDCQPVRQLNPAGGIALVYLGDESDPEVRAEAQRRLNIYADLGEQHGLESGRDFPGIHDTPHLQDPAWKSRPLNP